ncbi:MAG: hypothetical protein HQL96_10565 [Magnetococcales bacterium]|nr:hypothetical protein [Magnetococcales bacterium]
MNERPDIGHPEAGNFLLKVIVIFAVLGLGMSVATNAGPKMYDYFLLRDLANRVVGEYAKLPIEEVRRRIDYELHRSRLSRDDLTLTKTPKGYRVEVDVRIPIMLPMGDREFRIPGHEELILTYRADS